MSGDSLLSVREALDCVLEAAEPLPPEQVALSAACGRVLARAVVADVDLPPFPRCAMDGYALRAEDVREPPTSLKVVGTRAAGGVFAGSVEPGQAVKVMTGAPLPTGCDAVQMVERTKQDGGRVIVYDSVETGQHVAPRAEDLKAGDVALVSGTVIGPAEIGLLASVGHPEVTVHARPMATVVSTGDELVEVGETPGPGQIRNSNGPMLAVLARVLGCDPVQLFPAAEDDEEELRERLERGLESSVLLVSGGVSKGEKDLVGHVLEALGVEPLFHGVAIQPGKPLWFGRRGACLVFGLPGNPVSSLVTGRVFAGTAIRRLRGIPTADLRPFTARLTVTHERPSRRAGYLPARVMESGDGLQCQPLSPNGSADLVTACAANATWIAPAGQDVFRKGELVEVLLHEDHSER